jgi:hypothetical protein
MTAFALSPSFAAEDYEQTDCEDSECSEYEDERAIHWHFSRFWWSMACAQRPQEKSCTSHIGAFPSVEIDPGNRRRLGKRDFPASRAAFASRSGLQVALAFAPLSSQGQCLSQSAFEASF